MHTLISKIVALSVEKYYMALTEIQLKIYRFHGSLSQKGSRPRVVASGWPVVPAPPFKICASPFHVFPPGCYIHPIQYFKNVPPSSGFGPSFWLLAPLLLYTGDGPVPTPGLGGYFSNIL